MFFKTLNGKLPVSIYFSNKSHKKLITMLNNNLLISNYEEKHCVNCQDLKLIYSGSV